MSPERDADDLVLLSPPIDYELPGWELFFAELDRNELDGGGVDALRARTTEWVRETLSRETLAQHPAVSAMRRLFKEAGTDPTKYRPSSEALLRRLLKGEPMPAIDPLVDVNNCLSATLAVPCCVMAEGSFEPPFVFRTGREGESYESLRGAFRLDGKPLLLDARGPCDAPITGSARVKVTDATDRATLVAYLPEGMISSEEARRTLDKMLQEARTPQAKTARPPSS